jgi:hypothetical protein
MMQRLSRPKPNVAATQRYVQPLLAAGFVLTKASDSVSGGVWLVGFLSADFDGNLTDDPDQVDRFTHEFTALVFTEGSEYGINQGPVSKLSFAPLWQGRGDYSNCPVNFDRGWDGEAPTGPWLETTTVFVDAITRGNAA